MKVTVRKKQEAIPVIIYTEFIKLEAAMKLANAVPSGGQAKNLIQDGDLEGVAGFQTVQVGKELGGGEAPVGRHDAVGAFAADRQAGTLEVSHAAAQHIVGGAVVDGQFHADLVDLHIA